MNEGRKQESTGRELGDDVVGDLDTTA